MYKISKEFTFPMGHRLSKHKGRCQFIHGHNFKVIVGVKSKSLNYNDMVMDFGDLKKIVNEYIDRYCDHALALNNDDLELEQKMKSIFPETRVCLYFGDPTAEVLAQRLYNHIEEKLSETVYATVMMDYVTIYENDKSAATYEE